MSTIPPPDRPPDYPLTTPRPLESHSFRWANHTIWYPRSEPPGNTTPGIIVTECIDGPRRPRSRSELIYHETAAGIIKLGEMGLRAQLEAAGYAWEHTQRHVGKRQIDRIVMQVPVTREFCQSSNAYVSELPDALNGRGQFEMFDGRQFSYEHQRSKLAHGIQPVASTPLEGMHDLFFHAPAFAALSVEQIRMLRRNAQGWQTHFTHLQETRAPAGLIRRRQRMYRDFMELLDIHISVGPIVKLLEGNRMEARVWAYSLQPATAPAETRARARRAREELALLGGLATSRS